jgi:hypothetical protein
VRSRRRCSSIFVASRRVELVVTDNNVPVLRILPIRKRVPAAAQSTARRDAACEWEFVLERTDRSQAYIAALPQL